MAEIFSNYDCDVNQANLFEDLVRFLSAVRSSTVMQRADAIQYITHGPVPQTSNATLKQLSDARCALSVVCCAHCDGTHTVAYAQNARAFKGESLHTLNVLSLDSILAIVHSISRRCAVRAATRAAPPQWRSSTLVDARVSARSFPTWCMIDALSTTLVRLSALSRYDYPHSWYGYSQESDRAMLERNRSQSIEVPSVSADGPAAPTSVHDLREAKVRR